MEKIEVFIKESKYRNECNLQTVNECQIENIWWDLNFFPYHTTMLEKRCVCPHTRFFFSFIENGMPSCQICPLYCQTEDIPHFSCLSKHWQCPKPVDKCKLHHCTAILRWEMLHVLVIIVVLSITICIFFTSNKAIKIHNNKFLSQQR